MRTEGRFVKGHRFASSITGLQDAVMGYHGSIQKFGAFQRQSPHPGKHPTSALGTFFSRSPRLAALFSMDACAADKAYDAWENHPSDSLEFMDNLFRGMRFEPDARVLECRFNLRNAFNMPAHDWVDLVEEADQKGKSCVLAMRRRLVKAGYDGVVVPRWQLGDPTSSYGDPCLEYAADTFIVFDASQVAIQRCLPPALVFQSWDWHRVLGEAYEADMAADAEESRRRIGLLNGMGLRELDGASAGLRGCWPE